MRPLLQGHVGPAARGGSEVHASFAILRALAAVRLGLQELAVGPRGGALVLGDVDAPAHVPAHHAPMQLAGGLVAE